MSSAFAFPCFLVLDVSWAFRISIRILSLMNLSVDVTLFPDRDRPSHVKGAWVAVANAFLLAIEHEINLRAPIAWVWLISTGLPSWLLWCACTVWLVPKLGMSICSCTKMNYKANRHAIDSSIIARKDCKEHQIICFSRFAQFRTSISRRMKEAIGNSYVCSSDISCGWHGEGFSHDSLTSMNATARKPKEDAISTWKYDQEFCLEGWKKSGLKSMNRTNWPDRINRGIRERQWILSLAWTQNFISKFVMWLLPGRLASPREDVQK
jgi:hypothetical protein